MASLEEKIVHLKAEIVVYEKELAEATTPEEKKDLRQLITSTSEYLSRLLDRQREQARGSETAATSIPEVATLAATLYELKLTIDRKFGPAKTMARGSNIASAHRKRHFKVERVPFVTAAHDFKKFDSDEYRSALEAVVQTLMRNSADRDETPPKITTRFWPAVCNALRECEMLQHLFATCEMVDGKPYSYEVLTPGEVLVVDGVVDHALCLKDSTLCCLPLEDKSIGARMVAKRKDKSCSPEIAQVSSQVRAEVERLNRATRYVPEEYIGLLHNGLQWIAVSQKLVRGRSYCFFFVASDVSAIARLLEHALCTAAIIARQIYYPNQRPQRRTVPPLPSVEDGGDGNRHGYQQNCQNDYFVLPLTAANLASHFAAAVK